MKWLWIGGMILCLFIGNRVVYSSELHEFGHIGTVRMLKGQVRDPSDEPLADAMLELPNQETGSVLILLKMSFPICQY
ncbi:MAG: hypothetical protein HY774_18905 [Acidobacteria bacterium]|nr:hypothetical protein [Acidobacteriota bacterium]